MFLRWSRPLYVEVEGAAGAGLRKSVRQENDVAASLLGLVLFGP